MHIQERELTVPASPRDPEYLDAVRAALRAGLSRSEIPIRLSVTASTGRASELEVGVLGRALPVIPPGRGLLDFRPRSGGNAEQFNVALIVPTGIGARVGGHAGDATPVARALAGLCDHLITHPNVVNASDINEMTPNTLYVEGSVLDRLLLGTAGLRRVRANRLLVVIGAHDEEFVTHGTINAVNAARSTLGADCRVVVMEEPFRMAAGRSESGRAVGRIENLDALCAALDQAGDDYDAIAIASAVDLPMEDFRAYFDAAGEIGNPWGGVEAMLTHAVSLLYGKPSAHAPMLESRETLEYDMGVVDPRMGAEAVSMAFLNSVLKGLHTSPAIVTEESEMRLPHALSAEDVSCLVIPVGCLGLATLGALRQGIPVIAVRENESLMRNDLARLPWRDGQYREVENYWEAAGVLAAMKAGVDPATMRRPMREVPMERHKLGAGSIQQRAS